MVRSPAPTENPFKGHRSIAQQKGKDGETEEEEGEEGEEASLGLAA